MSLEVLMAVKDTNVGLLSCNTMGACRYIPTFWRNVLHAFSGMKM
jgi:hypothetical protein